MTKDILMAITLAVVLFFAVMFVTALFLFGCSDCKPEEYRCTSGERLQVCNSDESWSTVFRCSDFESFNEPDASVVCCDYDPMFDGEPNCMVERECEE